MQLVKLGRKYINLDHIHCIVEGTDKYVVYYEGGEKESTADVAKHPQDSEDYLTLTSVIAATTHKRPR